MRGSIRCGNAGARLAGAMLAGAMLAGAMLAIGILATGTFLIGMPTTGSNRGSDRGSPGEADACGLIGSNASASVSFRPATAHQARLSFASMRFASAGVAALSFSVVAEGEMGGAASSTTGDTTGAADVRPACLLKTRRRSTSPHAEHLKVWCSKPATGTDSSPATCSRRICAPHDKHCIRSLSSNDERSSGPAKMAQSRGKIDCPQH